MPQGRSSSTPVDATPQRWRRGCATGGPRGDRDRHLDGPGQRGIEPDLGGPVRADSIELSFALLLAVGSGGPALALGLSQRRRSYAMMTALGARRRHLRAFVFTETGVLTAAGLLAGAASGAALSLMLIKVLRGVFDPPPDTVAVPWPYLAAVLIIAVGALGTVSVVAVRMLSRRPTASAL